MTAKFDFSDSMTSTFGLHNEWRCAGLQVITNNSLVEISSAVFFCKLQTDRDTHMLTDDTDWVKTGIIKADKCSH